MAWIQSPDIQWCALEVLENKQLTSVNGNESKTKISFETCMLKLRATQQDRSAIF